MKAKLIGVVALLLMTAGLLLQGGLMADPPDGVEAETPMPLVVFGLGIVVIGALSFVVMKYWGDRTVQSTNPIRATGESVEPCSSSNGFGDRWGRSFCWIGASLSGLLIVAMVATAVVSTIPDSGGEGGRGIAASMIYFMVIPAIAILAGLFCLTGLHMSKNAMRTRSSPAHQTALTFATKLPVLGILCWIAIAMLMVAFGK